MATLLGSLAATSFGGSLLASLCLRKSDLVVKAWKAGIASLLVTVWIGSAQAAPATAQAEINQLLEDVGASGCAFYRNGSWYDSRKAESHLRTKYQMGRDRIKSAEDFIDHVATKSSLSGKDYEIRCGVGVTLKLSLWLNDTLLRNRASDAPR